MSPEAQRIAIAEACGWVNQGRAKRIPALLFRWVNPSTKAVVDASDLPDYLNDLNAMHESLKSQDARFNANFGKRLWIEAVQQKKEIHQLTAKDWADCFIWVLQTQCQGGN